MGTLVLRFQFAEGTTELLALRRYSVRGLIGFLVPPNEFNDLNPPTLWLSPTSATPAPNRSVGAPVFPDTSNIIPYLLFYPKLPL